MTDPALDIAVKIIAECEGFSAVPYQDQVGVWTIGYGATYTPDIRRVTALTPHMTQASAMAWLAAIVVKTLTAVRDMIHVSVTDNQTAAVTSLSYNEGTHAIRDSSLMIALNQKRYQEAADAFRSWVYAGGHVNEGLRRRRERERALFLTPDGKDVKPADISADDLNACELEKRK